MLYKEKGRVTESIKAFENFLHFSTDLSERASVTKVIVDLYPKSEIEGSEIWRVGLFRKEKWLLYLKDEEATLLSSEGYHTVIIFINPENARLSPSSGSNYDLEVKYRGRLYFFKLLPGDLNVLLGWLPIVSEQSSSDNSEQIFPAQNLEDLIVIFGYYFFVQPIRTLGKNLSNIRSEKDSDQVQNLKIGAIIGGFTSLYYWASLWLFDYIFTIESSYGVRAAARTDVISPIGAIVAFLIGIFAGTAAGGIIEIDDNGGDQPIHQITTGVKVSASGAAISVAITTLILLVLGGLIDFSSNGFSGGEPLEALLAFVIVPVVLVLLVAFTGAILGALTGLIVSLMGSILGAALAGIVGAVIIGLLISPVNDNVYFYFIFWIGLSTGILGLFFALTKALRSEISTTIDNVVRKGVLGAAIGGLAAVSVLYLIFMY